MLKKENCSGNEEPVRINKFLSDAGICSRREADRLIEDGKVLVDGKPALTGMKVTEDMKIIFNGQEIKKEEEFILLALNKPVGVECTSDRNNPDNIIDFVKYPKRVYTIGRLDKDSEGLILLTNDGDIVNKISKSSNAHEKEYVVKVNRPLTNEFIQGMQSGVKILDRVTQPCKVYPQGSDTFRIVLTQGLNRQIRRMCETLGYRVLKLKRIRVMNIRLGKLKTGTYRKVTKAEIDELREMIRNSKN